MTRKMKAVIMPAGPRRLKSGLTGHDDEPRGVAVMGLDVAGEDGKIVDAGREIRGQCAQGPVGPVRATCAAEPAVFGAGDRLDVVFRVRNPRHWPRSTVCDMAARMFLLSRAPPDAEQVDMHPHKGLIDDMEAAFRQPRWCTSATGIGSSLDRNHSEFRRHLCATASIACSKVGQGKAHNPGAPRRRPDDRRRRALPERQFSPGIPMIPQGRKMGISSRCYILRRRHPSE